MNSSLLLNPFDVHLASIGQLKNKLNVTTESMVMINYV